MQRRVFLKYSLAGLSALTLGLSAQQWFKTARQKNRRGEPATAGKDQISRILHLASLAPSGHNAQPWTVKILRPDDLVIGSRPAHWLPAVDPDNRELLLSIGTFCENLAQAAALHGFQAVFTVLAENGFSEDLIAVHLTPAAPATEGSEQALRERRTLRRHIESTPLTAEDLSFLLCPDGTAYYAAAAPLGQQLGEIILASNRSQTERPAVQTELADWIRWTEQDEERYNTGLTPDSMEMNPLLKWYARHFLDKKEVQSQSFKDETIRLIEEQVQNCAGWLIIKSSDASTAAIFQAGRTLEALWLQAKKRRLAFHPMTQPLEEPFWHDTLRQCFGDNIQFIIRIGYVQDYPPPVSLRLPVEKILV